MFLYTDPGDDLFLNLNSGHGVHLSVYVWTYVFTSFTIQPKVRTIKYMSSVMPVYQGRLFFFLFIIGSWVVQILIWKINPFPPSFSSRFKKFHRLARRPVFDFLYTENDVESSAVCCTASADRQLGILFSQFCVEHRRIHTNSHRHGSDYHSHRAHQAVQQGLSQVRFIVMYGYWMSTCRGIILHLHEAFSVNLRNI